MMTQNLTTPVHFRVVKHGANVGEVFGVILTSEISMDEFGAPEVPTFFDTTGPNYSSLTWIRHHTKFATDYQSRALRDKMQEALPMLGTITQYPRMTDRFRRVIPHAA